MVALAVLQHTLSTIKVVGEERRNAEVLHMQVLVREHQVSGIPETLILVTIIQIQDGIHAVLPTGEVATQDLASVAEALAVVASPVVVEAVVSLVVVVAVILVVAEEEVADTNTLHPFNQKLFYE
jgi:hypothetical protein